MPKHTGDGTHGFSPDRFLGSLGVKDVARPNLYRLEWLDSPYLSVLPAKSLDAISLRCISASMPGRGIGTTDKRRYGPMYKMPYDQIYDDISLTFMVSDNHAERSMFIKWIDYITGGETANISYYKEYISNLTIYQLDRMGNYTAGYILHEAFPISITPIELSYTNNDSYETFTVNMTYRYWVDLDDSYKE